jgi:hypothetical protein
MTHLLEQAIGDVVRRAHPCEDNACDIRAMLGRFHWALAARSLFEATDVPHGDPYNNVECEPDALCGECLHCTWEVWEKATEDSGDSVEEFLTSEEKSFFEWHELHGVACAHCDAILYPDLDANSNLGDVVWCSNCAKRSTLRYQLVPAETEGKV